MKTFKNIIKYLASVLLSLLVLISFYTLITTGLFKKSFVNIFGYTYFVIASGSMSGAIEVNDIIVVKLNDTYEVGDIVTYKSGDSFITHRVTGIEDKTITTKGDANNTEDSVVEKKDVIGRVSLILSSSFMLKLLGIIILIFIVVTVVNFEDIFKKYITKEKPKKTDSPIEYTQVIPIVTEDKAIIEDILSKTKMMDSVNFNTGDKVVELKLNTNKISTSTNKITNRPLDSDKQMIRDVLRILELNSKTSKITTEGATKLKYMYELCNTILINPKKALTVVENNPFTELYDYDFEDIGFTKKVQNRLYEMPVYVYLIIMIYAVVYDNDFYFDAVYKVLKYRIKIDKDDSFIHNNYKVDKCIRFIEKVVDKCNEKDEFKLSNIIDKIKLDKDLTDEK